MESLLQKIVGYEYVFNYVYYPNYYLFLLPNNAQMILNEREIQDVVLDFEGNILAYYDFHKEMNSTLG